MIGVQLEGIDLVFEGEAARVTDADTLEQAGVASAEPYGATRWRFEP